MDPVTIHFEQQPVLQETAVTNEDTADEGGRVNQHLPVVPTDILMPIVRNLAAMGIPATKMVPYVLDQVRPQGKYGISAYTIRRRIRSHNVPTVRSQRHSMASIVVNIKRIKETFPEMGARTMVNFLRESCGILATEPVVLKALRDIEPQEVARRRKGKYRRRQYVAAGVNENWTMDQHDKFKKYGIAMHVGIEPYAGYVLWAKVWHTNKNPRVVGGWYLEAVRKLNAIPMYTQSDPGSENYGVANMQTMIRQHLDPTLVNTIQHKWMRSHQNIKPEILWSSLRRTFSPGFENMLIDGFRLGIYDDTNWLQTHLYRWLVIPWMQDFMDNWVSMFNRTIRRACKWKILPQGAPPNLIFKHAHLHGSRDFKLVIPETSVILDEVEQIFAPPDDPGFELVPYIFERHAKDVYARIGGPPEIAVENFWTVFQDMWAVFNNASNRIEPSLPYSFNELRDEEVVLLPGYNKLLGDGVLQLPIGAHEGPVVEAAQPAAMGEGQEEDSGALNSTVQDEGGNNQDLSVSTDEELSRQMLLNCLVEFTDSEWDDDEEE